MIDLEEAQVRLARSAADLSEIEGKAGPEADARRTAALSQLLNLPRGPLDRQRADALFVAARQLHMAGKNIEALHPALLAGDLFQRVLGDAEPTARVMLLSGVILAYMGNHIEAAARFSAARDMATRMRSDSIKSTALLNLGNVWVETGANQSGYEAFREALRCAEKISPVAEIEVSRAAGNMAYVCKLLNKFEEALSHLQTAIGVLRNAKGADLALHLTNLHATAVEILLHLGRIEEARLHEDMARTNASVCGAEVAKLRAAAVTGLFNVLDGRTDDGIVLAEQATNRMKAFGQTYRGALLTLSQAQRMAGRDLDAKATMRSYAIEVQRVSHQTDSVRRRALSSAMALPEEEALGPAMSEQDAELRKMLVRVLSGEAALLRQAMRSEAVIDPEGLHMFRVGGLAGLLAERLGVDSDEVAALRIAACAHDIGMAGVPNDILRSARQWADLDEMERHFIQLHPLDGVEYIATKDLAHSAIYEQVIRHHHERFDGRGYPDALAGEAIPLPARVVAVCDAFDSMTHERPYAAALTIAEALTAMGVQAGRQFDPTIAREFEAMVREIGLSADVVAQRALQWVDSVPAAAAAMRSLNAQHGDRRIYPVVIQ